MSLEPGNVLVWQRTPGSLPIDRSYRRQLPWSSLYVPASMGIPCSVQARESFARLSVGVRLLYPREPPSRIVSLSTKNYSHKPTDEGRKAMSYTRRNFLSAVVAGSAASVYLPRVSGAAESPDHAVLGRSPMYRIPEILRAKTGLKIRSVETLTKDANVSVVRVRTDDGSEGFGQLSTFDADLTAQIMHRKVAPLALGQDPADLDTLVDRCIEANYKFPWSYVCRALSGLDTAIWDLLGKRAGKSVCELLGGQPRPFPVYGSSMSRDIKPPEEAARLGATARSVWLPRVQDPCGERERSRSRPMARPHRIADPRRASGRRPGHSIARGWKQLLHTTTSD